MVNVVTTIDRKDVLEEIGRSLLADKLVACLQIIGPIKSVYWWKGRLEETEEWIGIMKTRRDLYAAVEKAIRERHPYEVPEIMAVGADFVLPEYRQWVVSETSQT
jgi:periplasmic divalent cation tolerance protein